MKKIIFILSLFSLQLNLYGTYDENFSEITPLLIEPRIEPRNILAREFGEQPHVANRIPEQPIEPEQAVVVHINPNRNCIIITTLILFSIATMGIGYGIGRYIRQLNS